MQESKDKINATNKQCMYVCMHVITETLTET